MKDFSQLMSGTGNNRGIEPEQQPAQRANQGASNEESV
jgi:hypothetical protein